MGVVKRIAFAVLLFGGTACLLVGCSGAFFIDICCAIDRPLQFRFFRDSHLHDQTKERLVRFVVQRASDESSWSTVWHLEGSKDLDALDYGVSSAGFKTVVPPKPLEMSGQYRAFGVSVPQIGPIRYGSVYFHFGANGAVAIGKH